MATTTKWSVEDARVARAFVDFIEESEHAGTPDSPHDIFNGPDLWSALFEICPHPSYEHGGSMGDVCTICGAMPPDSV